MSFFLLYLWILTLVSVQCYRTPLPFGTGFQGMTETDELSEQGFFHLFGNLFKYALPTNERPLEPKMEGNDFKIKVKAELYDILPIGDAFPQTPQTTTLSNFFEFRRSGKLRCRPGSASPGCFFLLRIK